MSRVRQSDIDEGKREDPTSGAAADNRRFEQENRELEIAKEIPRRATSFFGAVLDPQHEIYLCSSTQINEGLMQVKGTPKVANPEGWLEGCSSCLTLIQVSSVATLSLSR